MVALNAGELSVLYLAASRTLLALRYLRRSVWSARSGPPAVGTGEECG
ncbi:MAG: hypothetical protein ACRCYX_00960 [Dermatophilaceae bacterium]